MGTAIATSMGVAVAYSSYLAVTARHVGIPPGQTARDRWRIPAALGAMALLLAWTGAGWAPPGQGGPMTSPIAAVPVGAVGYTGTLAGVWLAAGRPEGAEADVLSLFGGPLRRLRRADPVRTVPRR